MKNVDLGKCIYDVLLELTQSYDNSLKIFQVRRYRGVVKDLKGFCTFSFRKVSVSGIQEFYFDDFVGARNCLLEELRTSNIND